MLNSKFPMFLAWGPELTFLYNDAYAPILGQKHPRALGLPFNDVWSEIWSDIGPLAERALAGEAIWLEDLPLRMNRHGFSEETWFTFSYSPALDETGTVVGVFCACTETSEKVLALRKNVAERHRLEQLFGEAPAFMALVTGPDHVFELANQAYMQLVGHRDIIGKPVRTALPEVEGQGFFTLLDQVYATAEPFVGLQVPIKLQRVPHGQSEDAYVDFVYQPITDDAGTVTGIFATGYDVTALRTAQDRLRLAQEAGGIGSFELYPDSRTLAVSDEFCRIWGIPISATKSLDETIKSIHPDDVDRVMTALPDIDAHSMGYIEYRIVRQDTGAIRWIARRGEAVTDETRGTLRFAGVIYDITDQRIAEDALNSHANTLETLNKTGSALAADLDLDGIVQRVTDAGVALTGADFGAFFYNLKDEQGESLTLYTLSGAERSDFAGYPHPRATAVFKPTFDGDGNVRSDDITVDPRYGQNSPFHGMPDGHLPVRSYLAVPVKSRSGQVLGGLFFGHKDPAVFTGGHEELISAIAAQAAIAVDNANLYREARSELEQRRRAEGHQQLLINELNHRVKNTLSIVQSLAQQSFKGSTAPEVARRSFDARLGALAAAHNLLTRENWEQASLGDVVSAAVHATAGANSGRVSIEGPNVLLAPQTSVSVAMAIHELCTNAIKYGALSNEVGHIKISWLLGELGGVPSFHLEWVESGGPDVVMPSSRGFGSRMIERGLSAELGGDVRLDFRPDGLVCSIDAPLPRAEVENV
jgi:two-component sensor histidine kinase/PAS domain-containing protein